jgi:uncharacterized 2Fe-2S/4Fe-4S cluster protein (DUF4445 family)
LPAEKKDIYFILGGEQIPARAVGTILDSARSEDIFIEAPCNGQGTCAKCRVEVNGRAKLACQEKALPGQEVVINLGQFNQLPLPDFDLSPWREGKAFAGAKLSLCLDVGTSNVECALVDTEQGEILGGASGPNRQRVLGADVLTRIISAEKDERTHHRLVNLLRESVDGVFTKALAACGLKPAEIGAIALSTNTVMAHFLLDREPTAIRYQPDDDYSAVGGEFHSRQLGITSLDDTPVYIIPPISGYVGGDIVAGLAGLSLDRGEVNRQGVAVLIDGGTNGEVAVVSEGAVVALATSAGPAFEGGETSCGISAQTGAISSVVLDENLCPEYETIGGTKPIGICGSGLIQLLASLLERKVIGQDGSLQPDSSRRFRESASEGMTFIVVEEKESATGMPIYLSEVDIENIIRTKAAIQAGLLTALSSIGYGVPDIDRLYLSGNFGSQIDMQSAKAIGLLPRLSRGKIIQPGNSSLLGACAAALSDSFRRRVEELAKSATFLDLSTNMQFMEHFTASSFLPHTEKNWDL